LSSRLVRTHDRRSSIRLFAHRGSPTCHGSASAVAEPDLRREVEGRRYNDSLSSGA
jgi:hypothetical protein